MASRILKDVLQPQLVRVNMQASTKNEAILELLDILESGGLLKDRAEAERVVFEREKSMSTGLEHGIAIPHGKTDTVSSLIVALATKPEGIDFECADGLPARILIMTLSPASVSGPHIRFMAEVSQLLRHADLRDRILSASTAEDVVHYLTNG